MTQSTRPTRRLCWSGYDRPVRSHTDMLPLYRDPHFTFRFAEDRIIPRFHLDGVEPGTPVSVFGLDPATGERLELLAEVVAGEGGWVDLAESLVVRAGGGFVAVAGAPRLGE